MIECKRIYIDTSPYIYYLEKNPQYSDKVKDFFIKKLLFRQRVCNIDNYSRGICYCSISREK